MPSRLLPESAVLQSRDPTTTDSDAWPVFELVDVLVTDPDDESQAPTTLLHASAHNPLTVTGRLRPLPKHLTHLYLDRTRPSLSIETTDVRSYSYGAYEDGSIGLWACGQAGWFQISPSAVYEPTYEGMIEAVKLLHYIADTYATPRMSGKVGTPHHYQMYSRRSCSDSRLYRNLSVPLQRSRQPRRSTRIDSFY